MGYRDYVGDTRHMRAYAEYQQRYADTLRESDKVLIELVRAQGGASLLDVGCSTGNLLVHLSRLLPELELHGADLVEDIIEANRAALPSIEFHVANMLDLQLGRTFDVVVVNASLMFFTPGELRTALSELARVVAPGGALLGFDYVQPFDQELEIVETSAAFPDGLRLFTRSERTMREAFAAGGLVEPVFAPFALALDLPRPDPGSIRTWTPAPGMSFRGSLYQPWCHFAARKPA
jgi:ubiquinone/menaquinone biosynthesis C-methylase UbiE